MILASIIWTRHGPLAVLKICGALATAVWQEFGKDAKWCAAQAQILN